LAAPHQTATDRTGTGGSGPGNRVLTLERDAHSLADRLPDLKVEALRMASTINHGLHGRRRAGPGETFWQFRQFHANDSATLIDWRRSASSDHLYVREREWEAAHTFWLWTDLSPSMAFKSEIGRIEKRDRAVVVALAAAELLVRGGERVGLLGVTRPTASAKAASILAEAIALNVTAPHFIQGLPPAERIGRYSGLVLISDFLDPIETIEARLKLIAVEGVSGHLVQVLDPAEETLPYAGRTEFLGLEGEGRWIADRVESLRQAYTAKLEFHRTALRDMARRLGWSLLAHRTDRSAAEPLLALIQRLGIGHAKGAVQTIGARS
jgi:uncharacterized protein (DUF58 family)